MWGGACVASEGSAVRGCAGLRAQWCPGGGAASSRRVRRVGGWVASSRQSPVSHRRPSPTPVRTQGDFAAILKTLQRYPPLDVNILLEAAAKLPS